MTRTQIKTLIDDDIYENTSRDITEDVLNNLLNNIADNVLFPEDINITPYYDATVGTGGDYATLKLAEIAGKYNLKAVGDITIDDNWTIGNKIKLDLNGYSLIFGNYQFTIPNDNVQLLITNGTITYQQTSAKSCIIGHVWSLADNNTLQTENCTFTNLSTINGSLFAGFGFHNKVKYNLANVAGGAFGYYTGAVIDFTGIVNDIEFIGGGINCADNTYYGTYRNVKITGSYNATNTFFFTNADNIEVLSSTDIRINVGTDIASAFVNVNKIIDKNHKVKISMRPNGVLTNSQCNVLSIGSFGYPFSMDNVYVHTVITNGTSVYTPLRGTMNNITTGGLVTLSGLIGKMIISNSSLNGLLISAPHCKVRDTFIENDANITGEHVSLNGVTSTGGTIRLSALAAKTALIDSRTLTTIDDTAGATDTTLLANNLI